MHPDYVRQRTASEYAERALENEDLTGLTEMEREALFEARRMEILNDGSDPFAGFPQF